MVRAWAMRLLRDPRDAPLAVMAVRCSAMLPLAILVFVAPDPWDTVCAAAFLALYAFQIEPFITMFHDVSHRRLFRSRWLNASVNWLLGPIHGSTPNTYFTHHVLMHHAENNLAGDESTTLPYQRDRIADFARYYLRFFFSAFSLVRWLRRRPGSSRSGSVLIGEFGYLGVAGIAAVLDPFAATVVFAVPLLMTRSLLIVGNWGEHAFVDAAAPDDPFRSSTELVGERENRRAFNVGYHIAHHVRPGAHYTSHPEWFFEHRAEYARADAVVLRDLTYPEVWLLLMMRNYDALARRFVRLPGAPVRDHEEVKRLLRERVRPVALYAGGSA